MFSFFVCTGSDGAPIVVWLDDTLLWRLPLIHVLIVSDSTLSFRGALPTEEYLSAELDQTRFYPPIVGILVIPGACLARNRGYNRVFDVLKQVAGSLRYMITIFNNELWPLRDRSEYEMRSIAGRVILYVARSARYTRSLVVFGGSASLWEYSQWATEELCAMYDAQVQQVLASVATVCPVQSGTALVSTNHRIADHIGHFRQTPGVATEYVSRAVDWAQQSEPRAKL